MACQQKWVKATRTVSSNGDECEKRHRQLHGIQLEPGKSYAPTTYRDVIIAVVRDRYCYFYKDLYYIKRLPSTLYIYALF